MLTPSNSGHTKRKKKARALREKEEGSFDRHINVIQQSSFSPDYRSLCAALYLNIAVIFFNIHYYYYLFIHSFYLYFFPAGKWDYSHHVVDRFSTDVSGTHFVHFRYE